VANHPFVIHEYVRWSDVDPAGIIRYDAYTRFYELGESELLRSLGIPYREIPPRFDITIPRRVMHMEFRSPPVLDERLEVRVYVGEVRTTALTLCFDIYGEGGALRSDGYLVLVSMDRATYTKRPWPAEFLALLEPFRLTPEEARAAPSSSA
jgi:acyl-CoA thioester hydrolase